MKQSLLAAIAATALLLASSAKSEVLYNGKVYTITSDRIIKRDHLPCAYGLWQQQILTNGSAVLIRSKRCEAPYQGSGWNNGK